MIDQKGDLGVHIFNNLFLAVELISRFLQLLRQRADLQFKLLVFFVNF